MKKRFLAIAIATGLASPLAAQAEANVYGQLNVSYGMIENCVDAASCAGTSTNDNWQVNSHSSRLGVKGSEDLGNGLSANYQLEWEVNPDNAGRDLGRRNQWVGLKGSWGEVRFGRHDTPMKISQGKFDQFGDSFGDIVGPGAVTPSASTGISIFEDDRVDNVVAYLGKAGDVKYAIALVPGEGSGVSGAGAAGDGPADTISAAVIYASGPLYLAFAMDKYDDTSTTATEDDMMRLTALYNMGKMDFGFMYESEGSVSGTTDRDSMGISFAMGMGSNTAKFQYLTSTVEGATDQDTTSMSLGYDWGLSKATTLGVAYTDITEETTVDTATFTFAGVTLLHKF